MSEEEESTPNTTVDMPALDANLLLGESGMELAFGI
jgi:hypothetical protein